MHKFTSILDVVPTPVRGVIRIGANCTVCDRPEAILGRPGKGRPLDTFAPDYFCQGHAIYVD